jgi:curved DNA-binding protein CbpA
MSADYEDHYETLQISPNADLETVHRVYRILAQRYHPDNRETGSSERFHTLSVAYKTLSDPERRAAYDVQHKEHSRLTWKIFDQFSSVHSVDAERRKRQGVLGLLYRKRVAEPHNPYLTLKEMEDMLGVPKEHLEFTLWYLKEGGHIQRGDSGKTLITLKGVDLAEEMLDERSQQRQAYIEAGAVSA